jgi:hypothetical protein
MTKYQLVMFTLPLDKLGVNLAQGDISDFLQVHQKLGLSTICYERKVRIFSSCFNLLTISKKIRKF